MGWSPISSISFEMYRRVQPRQAWPPNAGHQKSSRMPALNLGNSSDHQLNDEVDGFGGRVELPDDLGDRQVASNGKRRKTLDTRTDTGTTPRRRLGTVRLPLDPPERLDMQ
jgi:hypothetical protein